MAPPLHALTGAADGEPATCTALYYLKTLINPGTSELRNPFGYIARIPCLCQSNIVLEHHVSKDNMSPSSHLDHKTCMNMAWACDYSSA